ncbi:VanZ family protein [Rothia sp. LK2492]|uniref:VanZ family protein n=1 Tax=Rothia sp. LK2492 TaxID=3114370 RepID=UPI0034CEC043
MIICATLTIYAAGIMVFTLFPLKNQEPFTCSRDPLRTTPFQSFAEVLDMSSSQGFTSILMSSQFLQIVCNVLLFMPLGFLARAVFKRSLLVSALITAGLSLAIELTQLTGIWGVYDCAYRIFDVDDLITNTAGGLLGATLALAWVTARRREERLTPILGAKR